MGIRKAFKKSSQPSLELVAYAPPIVRFETLSEKSSVGVGDFDLTVRLDHLLYMNSYSLQWINMR
jgi:hypothetical protein